MAGNGLQSYNSGMNVETTPFEEQVRLAAEKHAQRADFGDIGKLCKMAGVHRNTELKFRQGNYISPTTVRRISAALVLRGYFDGIPKEEAEE